MPSATLARAVPDEEKAHAAYAGKAATYFSGARADFVGQLPVSPLARVLEIGCGTGATGALALKEGKAGTWAGVELFPAAAAEARKVLSEVVVGDVEQMDLPWVAGSFDAAILSEVLEHLVDPWSVVERVARLVKPGGMVLASSPNVAHWRLIANLLRGRFELADQGVMDRTHMRWFTPASYAAMFERAGLQVVSVRPVTPFSTRTRLLSRLTHGRIDHLFMVQIAIEARRV